MTSASGSDAFPPALSHKLVACGYARLESLSHLTLEQFLSTCRLTPGELELVQELMVELGLRFRSDAIRYPFISPLLEREVSASGLDISQTSITTIGLPAWAEAPLLAGGIQTVQELVGSSTFYIRLILGYGGRPQNILRQRVEEHLLGLLRSVQQPESELATADSRPLQSLPLRPRTLNALRRAGIFTLEQLQRMTEAELSRLRGLGPKGLAEIQAVMPSSTPVVSASPDIAVQAEAISIRPDLACRPLAELKLPASLVQRLQSAGITKIGDLVENGQPRLQNIPRIGKASEARIILELEGYLLTALQDVGEAAPEIVAEVQAEAAVWTLDEKIAALLSHVASERVVNLLSWRFGLEGKTWTLEQVGKELGISRERARQLEHAALETLRRDHPGEVETLFRPAHETFAAVGGVATLRYLLEQLPGIYNLDRVHLLGAVRFLLRTSGDVTRMPGGLWHLKDSPLGEVAAIDDCIVTLLRKRLEPMPVEELTTEIARTPAFPVVVSRYPSFSLAARARANPHTDVLPSGSIALREWERTRLDETVRALRDLGVPSHYRQIAAQVQTHAVEDTAISVETIHNLLLTEAMFVRMRRGIFGLAEWQRAGPDIVRGIQALLATANTPLHRSELAQALGLNERAVERCLISQPEFSPAGNGYYKLTGRSYTDSDAFTGRRTAGAQVAARAGSVDARQGAADPSRGRPATVKETITAGRDSRFARVRTSAATHRSGALPLNASLTLLFPLQGELTVYWPGSQTPEQARRLRRGKAHVSGLSRFFRSEGVMPGDDIYIEHLPGPDPIYNLYTEGQWRATVISNLTGDESATSTDS